MNPLTQLKKLLPSTNTPNTKNTNDSLDETIFKNPISTPYLNFLNFEKEIFGEDYPIAHYDNLLIRYGEYRFLAENLPFKAGETILDLGCESNIFSMYLAYLGAKIIGVDINPAVGPGIAVRLNQIAQATGKNLDYTFKAADATNVDLPPASIDKVVAVSSIEHMYSERGHGDQLAVETIAKALKPGGLAFITVPLTYDDSFIESPNGDDSYPLAYRQYNQTALRERFLSNPRLETVAVSYLDFTCPDPRFQMRSFQRFWSRELSEAERLRWAWLNPVLSVYFHSIVSEEYRQAQPGNRYDTALIILAKKA